jgi:hypothetical protein
MAFRVRTRLSRPKEECTTRARELIYGGGGHKSSQETSEEALTRLS